MKSSKINEYKNMSVEQLQKELKELKNELFKLRFQKSIIFTITKVLIKNKKKK